MRHFLVTLNLHKKCEKCFLVLTSTHAVRLEDVATVAVAVKLGSIELENSALRLVVERDCKQNRLGFFLVLNTESAAAAAWCNW